MDGFTLSLIVVAYRFLIPLLVLRWPLGGYLLAMLADASDAMVLQGSDWGLFGGDHGYSNWDKALDLWMLTMALVATRKFWNERPARTAAVVLYAWRAAAIVTYYFWPHRIIFLFGPSIFENFYLMWGALRKWWPDAARRWASSALSFTLILLAATIPKVAQEYLMHYRYEDQTWNFFRTHIFFWLYD
jgi:hypothetical protein